MSSEVSTVYHFEINSNELSDRLLVPYYKFRHAIKGLHRKCEIRTVRDLCSIASGTYIDRYVPRTDGKLYLRVSNIREFTCDLNKKDIVYAPPNYPAVITRVIVEEDDVLLARTGTLGKASLARGPVVGAIMSQHVTRLRAKTMDVHPGYLTAFLNSEYGKSQLIHSGFGSTRPELTHSALGHIEIPIIEQNDQERIGRSVQIAVDRYYKSCKSAALAIQAYESAIGFEFSPKKFAVFEVPKITNKLWTPRYYRPDYCEEIDRLHKRFICKTVGEIAEVERGKGTRVSEYAHDGVPFIRTTDLINYGIDPFPDHYAKEATYNEFDQSIMEGDILFSIEGKIGSIAILTSDELCVFKNHIQRLRVKDSVSPEQLFSYLASRSGQFQADKNMVIQATIAGLSGRLKEIVVPIRPRMEDPNYDKNLEEALSLVRIAMEQRRNAMRILREARVALEYYLKKLVQ